MQAGLLHRAVAVALVSTCGLVLPASGHDGRAALEAELALEARQVAAELEEHAGWRRREVQELQRAAALATRVDRLVAAESTPPRELSRVEEELAGARGMAGVAAERAGDLRRSLAGRRLRLALLRDALARYEPEARDALSGRWQLQLLPRGQRGTATLRLEGALVSGSYQLDGGFQGSLRGTWVAGKLTLERIDAERGFDAVLEGRLVAAGRIAGAWRTTGLGGSDYAAGDWSAVRLPEENEAP